MAGLVQNVIDMVNLFADVATTSPVSAVLLLFGAAFVGISVLVFGYLALGGIGAAIIPEQTGRGPQQRG